MITLDFDPEASFQDNLEVFTLYLDTLDLGYAKILTPFLERMSRADSDAEKAAIRFAIKELVSAQTSSKLSPSPKHDAVLTEEH